MAFSQNNDQLSSILNSKPKSKGLLSINLPQIEDIRKHLKDSLFFDNENNQTSESSPNDNRLSEAASSGYSSSPKVEYYYTSGSDDEDTYQDISFKVIVVGNANCGKTSLIRQYTEGRFEEKYQSTVGLDYKEHNFCYKNEYKVTTRLWDIAGQDRYAKMTRAYFKGAKGAIVVWDVTRETTFDAVINWKKEIDSCLGDESIPVILLANKTDLLQSINDIANVGRRMERCVLQYGFHESFLVSAKKGDNIHQSMLQLISEMISQYEKKKKDENIDSEEEVTPQEESENMSGLKVINANKLIHSGFNNDNNCMCS